jgi:hypothetical protein
MLWQILRNMGNDFICMIFIWVFFLQQGGTQTDPKLYFWDIETDSLSYFNFETGKGEQDDYPPEQMVGMQSGSAIEMSDADRYAYTYIYMTFLMTSFEGNIALLIYITLSTFHFTLEVLL